MACHRFSRQVVHALSRSDPNFQMIQVGGGHGCDCNRCGDGGLRYREDTTVYGGRRVYDMIGGVMEWVADCRIQDYRNVPGGAEARAEPNCQQRVLRGGSWRNDQSYATASSRLGYDAAVRYYTNGFRVARDLE